MVFYQKEVSYRIFVMIAGIIGIGAFLLFFEGFYLRWYFILYGIMHIVYEYYSIRLIKKTPVIVSYDEFLVVNTPRLTYEIKWENIIKVTSKEGIEGGAYMTIFFKNEQGKDEKVILNFNYLELHPAYVAYSI